MNVSNIYRKTMVFNWLKLGLGMLTLFVCVLIFGLAWILITNLHLDPLTSVAIGCGAFLLAVIIYYFIMVKQGYAIKIGHLAIIGHALENNEIPPNPVAFAKTVVTARFGSNRHYYLIARDLSIAIAQIFRVIARGFSLDSDVPNLRGAKRLSYFLSLPALGYADECCLAYALRQRDYEVNAACTDALTILAQNWKTFFSRALRLGLIIIFACLAFAVIIYIPGLAICRSISISAMPWLGISLFATITFKIAFLDSWILTKMIQNFLELAEKTKIEHDNYRKLDAWSKSYAKIRKSAEHAAEHAEHTKT
ncbi:MAG: hypothetical protein FWC40_02635 [Proteobacteria bacterium]|nr:hypothetical protein [Pseudomonadota bacterium]